MSNVIDQMEKPPTATEAAPEAPEAGREVGNEQESQESTETPAEKVVRLEEVTVRAKQSVSQAETQLGGACDDLDLDPGETDAPGIDLDKAAVAKYEQQLAEAKVEAGETARAERVAELKKHFAAYLELRSDADVESLRFETADRLTGDYADQFRFLNDPRLNDTMIVVVPDRLWVKGSQPSESSAEQGTILIREGYMNDPNKKQQDEVAWMTHELGHIQRSKDVGERYAKESEEKAFSDLEVGTYPNNKVEQQAFGRQFEYLRTKGAPRSRVVEMLKDEYGPEEFKFLDRLLDQVYGRT